MKKGKVLSNEIRDIGSGFKIIKDMEDDDLFYAATQEDFDGENEWSIISSGINEIECMQNLLKEVYKKYKNCHDKIIEFAKSITHRGDIDTSSEFYLESNEIKREADFGHNKLTSFDALSYDKETNTWCRFYR